MLLKFLMSDENPPKHELFSPSIEDRAGKGTKTKARFKDHISVYFNCY